MNDIGNIDSQLMDLRQVLLGSNTCAPSQLGDVVVTDSRTDCKLLIG